MSSRRHAEKLTAPEIAEARRRVRAVYQGFLAEPRLRKRLRRAVLVTTGWLVLGLVLTIMLGRVLFHVGLPRCGGYVPFVMRLLPERPRALLGAIMAAGPDHNGEPSEPHRFLDRAEALGTTPYTCYLRASLLWEELGGRRERRDLAKPGPEDARRIHTLRAALAAGAQGEPDNLFWSVRTAVLAVREGKAADALRIMGAGAEGRRVYRIPAPDAPLSDLILACEHVHRILFWFFGHELNEVAALAAVLAHDGRLEEAKALAGGLDETARAALESYAAGGEPLRRAVYLQIAMWAALSGARLADDVPALFTAEERARLTVQALALDALYGSGIRSVTAVDFEFWLVTVIVPSIDLFTGLFFVLVLSVGIALYAVLKPQMRLTAFARLLTSMRSLPGAMALMCALAVGLHGIFKGHHVVVVCAAIAAGGACLLLRYTWRGMIRVKRRDRELAGPGPWDARLVRVPAAARGGLAMGTAPILALVWALFWVESFEGGTVLLARTVWSPSTVTRDHVSAIWQSLDARFDDLNDTLRDQADSAAIRLAAEKAGIPLPHGLDPKGQRLFGAIRDEIEARLRE